MTAPSVVVYEGDADVARTHAVMRQLRPHVTLDGYVAQVARQRAQGYRLVGIGSGGVPVAWMGCRMAQMFAWGRVCYGDAPVVDDAERGRGHGAALWGW